MNTPVIDFHAHVFPDAMARKVLPDLSENAGIDFFSDGTVNRLLEDMDDAGIDISLVSRITTKPHQTDTINQWLMNISGDRILPMAAWHPDLPVSNGEIECLKRKGFRCIKLHPDYQNFFVDEERAFPLYESAQDAGMPVLVHAGPDRGLPPPVHALPENLLRVNGIFPGLKLIAAHMGGEDNYKDTLKYLAGTDVYLDTSFVLRKMPGDILERMVKEHSADRIIYGSDTPWNRQKEDIEFLFSLSYLNDDEKAKIAGKNAMELLGLHLP